jgi:trimethylamine--corrinoid protein Co-methyltransferase
MVLSSVNSPLTYGFGQAEVAMVSAELAIPVVVNSSAVSGASAPVTLAGALMQMHAEMLAAVAIIQLHRPGAAVMYAGHPVVMDMRAGTAAMGTPEGGLLAAGCIEIGQHCGLPTGSDGLTSDSCTADALAVADKWASAFLAVLAGANMNGAAGVIGTQSTVSLEQLVIDDDIYGAMFRQQRGLAVDDDRLALPVIARVGHNGQFVTDNHTFSHYRSEVWYPRVANRMDAPTWEASGAKDAAERARDIVHDILATPQEQFLAPEQLREINTLVMEAEKVLASVKTPM